MNVISKNIKEKSFKANCSMYYRRVITASEKKQLKKSATLMPEWMRLDILNYLKK